MNVKQRGGRLEQATVGGDEPRLLVIYDIGGGMVSAGGEVMSEEVWRKRHQPTDADIVVRFTERRG